MAATDTTALAASVREPAGSRAARRLRRTGNIPGIIYGGGEDPVAFEVNARELRNALANPGALLDLRLDGARGTPVVLKEHVRHPVSGATMHVDFLRVRLDTEIQAQVAVELIGVDDAPGTKEGGVLEHATRELAVQSLPAAIPSSLQHDISEMKVGDVVTVGDIVAPEGVTIVSEPETVVATMHAPRRRAGTEGGSEIEAETELVGESAGADAGAAADAAQGDGDAGAAKSDA